MNSSHHLVFKLVCIKSMCTRPVCVLHNCTQNNMKQKEKGIFIGDENLVKCATVRPLIYSVFISQWLYKIAESMLELLYIVM